MRYTEVFCLEADWHCR